MTEGFPAHLCSPTGLCPFAGLLALVWFAGRWTVRVPSFEEGIESSELSPSLYLSSPGARSWPALRHLPAAGWPAGRGSRAFFRDTLRCYSSVGLRLSSCTLQDMEWNAQREGRVAVHSSPLPVCSPLASSYTLISSNPGPGRAGPGRIWG